MDKSFEMITKMKPSGDQPQAIESLVKGLERLLSGGKTRSRETYQRLARAGGEYDRRKRANLSQIRIGKKTERGRVRRHPF